MIRPGAAWLAAVVALLPAGGGAVERTPRHHLVSVTAGYDDNTSEARGDREGGTFGAVYYRYRRRFEPDPEQIVTARYSLGLRTYPDHPGQDALITAAETGWEYMGIRAAVLGLEAGGKLRTLRDGDDNYLRGRLGAHAGRALPGAVGVRLDLGAGVLDWGRDREQDYRFWRVDARVERPWFASRLTVGLHLEFQRRDFRGDARKEDAAVDSGRRRDDLCTFGIESRWTRWAPGRLAYSLLRNESNSFGESYLGHAVLVAVSRPLGARFGLHALGLFQFRNFQDEVRNPDTRRLEENDEDLSQFTLRLSWRLTGDLSAEGTYLRLWSGGSPGDVNFRKNVFTLGFTWRI